MRQFRLSVVTEVADSDIAFAVQAYRSREQLRWCLGNLRQHYPSSRVAIIVDGDGLDYTDIADQYGCLLRVGGHLCSLKTADRYVTRLLTELAGGNETFVVKIDPDTKVWRRLTAWPAQSAVFGTLETVTEGHGTVVSPPPNVQGGCIGMTRDVVEEMLASGILNVRTCVEGAAATWARCSDMKSCIARGRICDDFIISWAADRVHAPLLAWPEVASAWRRQPENKELRFAITHPHKLATPAFA